MAGLSEKHQESRSHVAMSLTPNQYYRRPMSVDGEGKVLDISLQCETLLDNNKNSDVNSNID